MPETSISFDEIMNRQIVHTEILGRKVRLKRIAGIKKQTLEDAMGKVYSSSSALAKLLRENENEDNTSRSSKKKIDDEQKRFSEATETLSDILLEYLNASITEGAPFTRDDYSEIFADYTEELDFIQRIQTGKIQPTANPPMPLAQPN